MTTTIAACRPYLRHIAEQARQMDGLLADGERAEAAGREALPPLDGAKLLLGLAEVAGRLEALAEDAGNALDPAAIPAPAEPPAPVPASVPAQPPAQAAPPPTSPALTREGALLSVAQVAREVREAGETLELAADFLREPGRPLSKPLLSAVARRLDRVGRRLPDLHRVAQAAGVLDGRNAGAPRRPAAVEEWSGMALRACERVTRTARLMEGLVRALARNLPPKDLAAQLATELRDLQETMQSLLTNTEALRNQ